MRDINDIAFINLFRETCEKGLGHPLRIPLSEPDSKILSNKIFEQTGLVIGTKSIKNYSFYVLQPTESKKENPSISTLDTFARYVLNAPYTEETRRKDYEDHHPYWYQYRSRFVQAPAMGHLGKKPNKKSLSILIALVCLPPVVFLIKSSIKNHRQGDITESFDDLSENFLRSGGWSVKSLEPEWWTKRQRTPGHLSLYTLRGDNWSAHPQVDEIKNLVYRKLEPECFSAEIRLSHFIPQQNWQQAGILLSEDESFTGKVLRLSLAYNNFFGGYEKPPEIIVQGLSSSESGNKSKPEEFVHFPLFNLRKEEEKLASANLMHTALKIEKNANSFRFLYSAGSQEAFAFKEIISKDFSIRPRYIGLFATQGLADSIAVVPADFDYFRLVDLPCGK